MANKIRIDEGCIKTLVLISEGVFPAKISSRVGIRLNALIRRLYRYEKEGLITRHNKLWNLTDKGHSLISRRALNVEPIRESIRKHDIRIKIPLREPLENPQVYLGRKGVSYNAMGLKNVYGASFVLEKHIVELMPRSAVIILPDIEVSVETRVEELAALTYGKLESILNNVELRLGVRFKRPNKDFFLAELISQEIAFKNHPIAVSMKGIGSGVWVIEYDEEDNKPRLILDHSHGAAELEAVHRRHAVEDAALIQRRVGGFLEEVKGGQFDEWRSGIQEVLSEYGEYLKAHVPFVQKADKVLGEILEERARQTRIIGNDASQGRPKSTLEMSSKELKEFWAGRRGL